MYTRCFTMLAAVLVAACSPVAAGTLGEPVGEVIGARSGPDEATVSDRDEPVVGSSAPPAVIEQEAVAEVLDLILAAVRLSVSNLPTTTEVAPVVFDAAPDPQFPLFRHELGCFPGLMTADGLDRVLAEQLGPILGFDNVHIVTMGGDRYVWLMHDAFVDYPDTAGNLKEGTYLHNWVLDQVGECLTFVHRMDGFTPMVFEPGIGELTRLRFFWPMGGEVLDGTLWVFWAEMAGTPEPPPTRDGLTRHPVGTWLAGYDATTLERKYFERAPNSGVYPQYGFAVSSDDHFSYLFGNANMLNLSLSGGLFGGPHPSIHMYVARVPRGQLHTAPQYWDGHGWSVWAADAVPFSSRFWTENTMQPRFLDGRWVSVVKKDGFWGEDVLVEIATRPEGPWTTVSQFDYVPRFGHEINNSYQPILAPWTEPDGRPIVIISQNGRDWPVAVDNPPWYRPSALAVNIRGS